MGRAIVIDPSHRNEADLRALGEELRVETSSDPVASVEVFDSRQVAIRRDWFFNQDHPVPEDRHYVGLYTKTPTAHDWRMFPHGWNDKDRLLIVVTY